MITVTSGWRYIDIDGYAGCIVYAELLRRQGMDARALCTGPLNESITPVIRSWTVDYQTDYSPAADEKFVLVDISEPEFFEKFVDLDHVVGVIDHHPGYETLWTDKIGDWAVIEPVGAACTLVAEAWEAAGLLNQMPAVHAGLLMSGILDNTLNFGAKITKDRDRDMYQKLAALADLPDNWPEVYFGDCMSSVLADLPSTLLGDYKQSDFRTLGSERIAVGQLVVWDAAELVADKLDVINNTFDPIEPEWFINLVSIKDGVSYFYSHSDRLKPWLSGLLDIEFKGELARADRMWLRKEIFARDQASSS